MSRIFGKGEVKLRLNHVGRKLRSDESEVVLVGSTSSLTVARFYLDGVTTRLGKVDFNESMLMKLVPVVL